MDDRLVNSEQITEIKGKILQRCYTIEYNGGTRPHFNTVAAYVKHQLGVRRISEIPKGRFFEVERMIQQFQQLL